VSGASRGTLRGDESREAPVAAEEDQAVQDDPRMTSPDGDVYDWYVRGMELLAGGNAAAAAALLEHAVLAEPESRNLREALARAQYGSGAFRKAHDNFAAIVAENPSDDYAQFGLGLAASRLGDFEGAVEHLALAVAMRPDNRDYDSALQRARARRART
jgi:Flp pilus assembly protein TadD